MIALSTRLLEKTYSECSWSAFSCLRYHDTIAHLVTISLAVLIPHSVFILPCSIFSESFNAIWVFW